MYLGLEFLFTPHLITPRRWRRHVRLHNMEENLNLLIGNNRGLIFLTGHFGNWEVVGYTMAALGFPMTAVARHLDNPYINRHVLGLRQQRGMTILDKRGATEAIPRLLEHGGSVGFIADQDAGKKGCFVNFFGRKASTYKSIALLAMQYRVPVIVGYGKRLSDDFSFEIGIQRYIYPEEWEQREDPRTWITQEYTKALEDVIREAPDQYLWVHRRWKHRPGGEKAVPDGIA
jgi:KDO2-lipid IV(A) lauroyltransferase